MIGMEGRRRRRRMQQEGSQLKARQRGLPDPDHTGTLASEFSALRTVRKK